MKLAIVAAGYTPGEADQLRRAMAAWKRHGGMEKHRDRITKGMLERGFTADFAAQLFEQIKGFGSYGFPESHAASFAGIVYASCWLKCHHPAAFACALLNSQPMGFYSPSQIVQDTKRHRIGVLPVDVRYSEWHCTLEPDSHGQWAIRLGFRQIRGFQQAVANEISRVRGRQSFIDIADLCARADLDKRHQVLLADAAALRGLTGHRHRAQWSIAGVEQQLPLFGNTSPAEQSVVLPVPTQAESTLADYAHVGLTLGPHPLQQIRSRLRAARCMDGKQLACRPDKSWVRVAGLVTLRQRPDTASGVTFVTLEDEHGMINVIVWRRVAESHRRELMEAQLLGVEGYWQVADGTCHVVAGRLLNLTHLLGGLDARSRDFR